MEVLLTCLHVQRTVLCTGKHQRLADVLQEVIVHYESEGLQQVVVFLSDILGKQLLQERRSSWPQLLGFVLPAQASGQSSE